MDTGSEGDLNSEEEGHEMQTAAKEEKRLETEYKEGVKVKAEQRDLCRDGYVLIPENCFISLYKRSLSRFYNMQEKSHSSMLLLQDHDSKKKSL